MKKILIAYDGSPGAETAITDLVRGGFPARVEAKVLSVADVWLPPEPPPGEQPPPEPPSVAAAREKAVGALQEAKEIAVKGARRVHELFPEWRVTNLALADSPAWAILEEARNWPADLVVIGSHGRTPLERLFLGSVSTKVAAEAGCSVRVVRPRTGPLDRPEHIMLALDGSEDSNRAADEVVGRQWAAGTRIDLVTVLDPKLRSGILGRCGPFGVQPPPGSVEESIRQLLDSVRAKFEAQEVKVEQHVLEGDPKRAILRHAADREVDTIFLGARGIEHGNRLYLGTVASAVCTRAPCTVEIVRPPAEARTGLHDEIAGPKDR